MTDATTMHRRISRRLVLACGGVVAVSGLSVLAGWWWNLAVLKGLVPGLTPMNPVTAISFGVVGVGLSLLSQRSGGVGRVGMACAVFVALAAALRLADYLFDWKLDFDCLFWREQLIGPQGEMVRMAPNTAFNFLLAAVALGMLDVETRRGWRPSQLLALVVAATSLLVVVGYVYGEAFLLSVRPYVPMALNTALTFLVLSAGILSARMGVGIWKFWSLGGGGLVVDGEARSGGEAGRRLGWKIGLGFAGVLVVVTVIGAFSYRCTVRYMETARSVGHTQEVVQQMTLLFSLAEDLESGARGYALTGNEDLMEPADHAIRKLHSTLRRLTDLTADNPSQQDRLKSLAPLIEEKVAFMTHGVELRRQKGLNAAAAFVGTGRGKAIMDSIREVVHNFTEEEQGLYAVRNRAMERSAKMSLAVIPVGSVVAFVLVGVAGIRIHHDILARRDAELQVERARTSLAAANKELEAFSYSVSHDLRAPLRHINGFSDMLQRHARESLDEKGRRYLATIAESAQQMGALIDDLLVFSRMGHVQMNVGGVDMDRLAREVVEGVGSETGKRTIEWKIHDLPRVRGDVSLLRQVLVNLVSNAVKYTRPRSEASIEIRGRTNGSLEEVVVFVRDNGVGFDMKYADKLFGVFQRLHRASEFEGTGVGLANVRRIVERHGGRVWAEGAVDAGATIFFSLPKWRGDRVETASNPGMKGV